MDPDEYQRASREGWGGVARMLGQLNNVLLGVFVALVLLWVLIRFWDRFIEAFDIALSWLPYGAGRVPSFVAVLVRQDRIRWCCAFAGAIGTLAVGTTAGVLQLDGGWWLRKGEFWCRKPKKLEEALGLWAGLRQKKKSKKRRGANARC